MSLERNKYRNPPTPLGYIIKIPELVVKKVNKSESIYISGMDICNEPDVSIFENFCINEDSEEEEDITEVPVVPHVKKVEVLDIIEEDENMELSENVITVKMELDSPKHSVVSETSEDLLKCSKDSAVQDKRDKKHARVKRKHKKAMKIKGDLSDSSHTSNSYYRSKHKRKLDENDSDSQNRSHYKETDSYSSDSDSYIRSRRKKRESYDSDTHSKRDRYSSHSKSHRSDRYKKRSSSYHRRLSEKNDIKEDDSDSDSYETKPKKEFNKVKTEYTYVRIGKREPSYPPAEICKEEYVETDKNANQEPCLLYGDYRCDICKVTVNSAAVYESHINGKKHQKAVEKAQTENKLISKYADTTKPLLPLPGSSRYPKPPPGYCRKKLDCAAVIQARLDCNDQFPCPGLDKVTEIRSPTETTYYCSFCDTHCSCNCIIQHLSGFKHQLNSVKFYRNDLYQKWGHKQKCYIINDIIAILRSEEKRSGKGVIKVEKDYRETDVPDSRTTQTARKAGRDEPSTSTQVQDVEFLDEYVYNSLPDPTKSGYYCKLCDSHSNSEAMWQSHIIGKRHVTNLKKNPGAHPSKCKYIPAEKHVRPKLFDMLRMENVDNSPVVGLSQIREILKPDIKGVLFNCFLCGGCMSSVDIVSHVLSMKHKEKYLNSINHPQMETLNNCQIPESCRFSIVEEICYSVEADEGSGTPEVYYAKSAVRS